VEAPLVFRKPLQIRRRKTMGKKQTDANFFSSRSPHPRLVSDWSSDVCSSDLVSETRHGGSTSRRLKHFEGDVAMTRSSSAGADSVGRVLPNQRFRHQEKTT